MPPTPSKPKTNFKTYEAQTRLLAAVVATTGAKLDFAAIAKHIGKDATKDAINHRLRPIKQLAKMQAACVANGEDPGELPVEKQALAGLVGGGVGPAALEHRMRPIKQLAKLQLACRERGEDPGELPVEKDEIQKLFGESTPSGLEWQFREIKALGKAQQEAVANGENPAEVAVGAGTPKGGKGAASKATGSALKRKKPISSETVDDDDNGDDDMDVQDTPSKRPAAAKKARQSNNDTPTPTTKARSQAAATPTSIFGDGTGRGGFATSIDDSPRTALPSLTSKKETVSRAFDDQADELEDGEI